MLQFASNLKQVKKLSSRECKDEKGRKSSRPRKCRRIITTLFENNVKWSSNDEELLDLKTIEDTKRTFRQKGGRMEAQK